MQIIRFSLWHRLCVLSSESRELFSSLARSMIHSKDKPIYLFTFSIDKPFRGINAFILKKGGKHILLLFKLLHDSKNSMSLLLGKKGGGIKCQMENQKALLGKHF